ncbi:hypothetical protein AALA00_02790 [Lachnospiraceae bacterium 46-15]
MKIKRFKRRGMGMLLAAAVAFTALPNTYTSYGEVQFVMSDSVLAGSAAVEALNGRKGRARLVIPASTYGSAGEKYYRAMYDGADTPYHDSISVDCRVDIGKRIIENPVLEDVETVCRNDASAGAGALGEELLPHSGSVTVYGTEISYRIDWNPSESYRKTEGYGKRSFRESCRRKQWGGAGNAAVKTARNAGVQGRCGREHRLRTLPGS